MRMLLALLLAAFALSALAAHPGTLVVLSKAENTASLIDLVTKKSVATLPTGEGPHEVAVSPDGKIAVVCNYGSSPTPGNTLTVIDVGARKPLRTIDLGKHVRPHGIAWLRGNHVAVTTEGTKTLLIVDIGASKVTAAIETDQFGSHMVALAPAHDRAFVANIDSGSVSVSEVHRRRQERARQTRSPVRSRCGTLPRDASSAASTCRSPGNRKGARRSASWSQRRSHEPSSRRRTSIRLP